MASLSSGSLSSSPSSLLTTYNSFVLSQLNPQQFDVVSNFQTFKIISSIKAVLDNSIAVSTPLTELEAVTGIASDLIVLAVSSRVSDVKIGIVSTVQTSLSTTLINKVNSNPITITLPDTSVCSSLGCSFTTVLQTVNNAVYFNGSATASTQTTQCGLTPSTAFYDCSNRLNVTVVCDGTVVETVLSTCPYTATVPTCERISGSDITNDVCTMTSYTSTQTTCLCHVPVTAFALATHASLTTDISKSKSTNSVTIAVSPSQSAVKARKTRHRSYGPSSGTGGSGSSRTTLIILCVIIPFFGLLCIAAACYYCVRVRVDALPGVPEHALAVRSTRFASVCGEDKEIPADVTSAHVLEDPPAYDSYESPSAPVEAVALSQPHDKTVDISNY